MAPLLGSLANMVGDNPALMDTLKYVLHPLYVNTVTLSQVYASTLFGWYMPAYMYRPLLLLSAVAYTFGITLGRATAYAWAPDLFSRHAITTT